MNNPVSYIIDYPVYPGRYTPLPEVAKRLEKLQLSKKDRPLNPLLNMDEFEDCYKINVVIPGVSREDIFVDVQNNILLIRVLHRDIEEHIKKFSIHEFEGKYFERQIVLPYNADPAFVSSQYDAGILRIYISKSEIPMKSFCSQAVTY